MYVDNERTWQQDHQVLPSNAIWYPRPRGTCTSPVLWFVLVQSSGTGISKQVKTRIGALLLPILAITAG